MSMKWAVEENICKECSEMKVCIQIECTKYRSFIDDIIIYPECLKVKTEKLLAEVK